MKATSLLPTIFPTIFPTILPTILCAAMVAVPSLATASEGGLAAVVARPPTQMRFSAMLVPTPIGNVRDGSGGSEDTFGTQPTVGVMAAFDFVTRANVFVGLAPSYVAGIKARADYDVVSSREFDLLVRLGYAHPLGERFHVYGYLAPGYSFVSGRIPGLNAQGPVLGVHAGGLFDLTPSFFLAAELGYQAGFQRSTFEPTDVAMASSFVQIGLGVGARI
jgi:hypothetical protein